MPTVDAALHAVRLLDNVSFFKVGLQLFMTGGMPALLQALRGKRVFVDLKVPGDIGNTIKGVIDVCYEHGVAFLTLSDSMPAPAIRVSGGCPQCAQRVRSETAHRAARVEP